MNSRNRPLWVRPVENILPFAAYEHDGYGGRNGLWPKAVRAFRGSARARYPAWRIQDRTIHGSRDPPFIMAIRGLTYEWCIRYPDFDFKKEAQAHFWLLLDGIRM